MTSMRESFKQHALLWGGSRGPFVSEEEEQEEIRLFAARLSPAALKECLEELATWQTGVDLDDLA